jgi:hypothetical protein
MENPVIKVNNIHCQQYTICPAYDIPKQVSIHFILTSTEGTTPLCVHRKLGLAEIKE